MSINFDGNGTVSLPAYAPSGAFTLAITFTYSTTGNDQYVLSTTTNGANYIRCTNGSLEVRLNFTTFSSFGSYVEGEEITLTISRDGAGDTTISDGTTTSPVQSTTNGTYNQLGCNQSASIKYDGNVSALSMTGGGVGDRTYNFNQTPGSTTLPDTVSAQDGTLTGFTTGGFLSVALSLTSVGDYECKKRDANGEAVFTLSGTKDATDTDIEYSLDNGITWATLDTPGTATTFSGNVTIKGQKSVKLRFASDHTTTASVQRLTAALSIVAWWQSNTKGSGTFDQTVDVSNSNIIPVMYTDSGFEPLADPCDSGATGGGSVWPRLASFFANKGIPVCIANVAVGGTSITTWIKGAPQDYYSRITAAATGMGGANITISIGGESDASGSMNQATMEGHLNDIVGDLAIDLGTKHYLCKFPIGDTTGGNTSIWNGLKAAYDAVVASNVNCFDGGDLSVIDIDTTTDAGNDGIHLKLTADLNLAAEVIYNAITGSTVDLDLGDIPNGSHRVLFHEAASGDLIDAQDVTFTSGLASATIPVLVGTEVQYSTFNTANKGIDGDGGSGIAVAYA